MDSGLYLSPQTRINFGLTSGSVQGPSPPYKYGKPKELIRRIQNWQPSGRHVWGLVIVVGATGATYFILFYFILFYFILFYFILFIHSARHDIKHEAY